MHASGAHASLNLLWALEGALTGLLAVFRTLKMVVKDVMAVIFETISQTIDQFGNLAELISAVLHGDFDAAAAAGS